MSAPASSYSYSEYTIAPSEASLNARWYNQIQQWTNRLPLESPSSVAPGTAHSVIRREDPMRRRDVDQGTEAGTVLPMHSVSRRASLAERRRWTEQMPEPKATLLTDGGDVVEDVTTAGHRGRPSVMHPGTTSNQSPETPSYSKVSPARDTNATQKASTPRTSRSIVDETDIALPKELAARLEPIAIRSGTDVPHLGRRSIPADMTTRPTRGRRPPTPYHPPSDVALTEIPESSVGGEGETLQREVCVDPV
jgi:hypothetical protein